MSKVSPSSIEQPAFIHHCALSVSNIDKAALYKLCSAVHIAGIKVFISAGQDCVGIV